MKGSGYSKAVISMLFVMLVWGSSFAVTKNAITIVPPLTFALLRFLTASICLQAMLMLRKKNNAPKKRIPFVPLLVMGLTGVTCFYTFFNYSLVYTSASMGALIQAFIPVIIALLAFIFLKEKISGIQQLSILISVTGVALVSYFAHPDTSSGNPFLGNCLMLVAVIAWSVYTVVSKKLADYDVLKVTCYSTYIGTAFLIPFVMVELWHKPLPAINAEGWISIIYLGVVASAVSYYLYNHSLKLLSASLAGIFINLDPVVGAALAIIFLHEEVTVSLVVGSLMVLAGTWISARK